MNNETAINKVVTLRPDWKQFIDCHLFFIAIEAIALVLGGMEQFGYNEVFLYISIIIAVYLAYQLLYFTRMKYIITAEQLIYIHGIFYHSTDYLELYRVVDYQQNRSLLQQILGLKTVVIQSGDRNTPILNLVGIKVKEDVVSVIRKRVEYNKKAKGIYEITNRL